jgi:protein gp37
MGQNSKIEWTHHTRNLWWGCEEVHIGCENCYAKKMAGRFSKGLWEGSRQGYPNIFDKLAQDQRRAFKKGELHREFVGSMMDVFEKSIFLSNPTHDFSQTGQLREELFNRISSGMYPNLLFLFLTKRPSNICKMVPSAWLTAPPTNVMYGTSLSEQRNETLVDQLLKAPGNHFLSVEPQVSFIELRERWFSGSSIVNWVIQGGESGIARRPFDVGWATAMRDQCSELGVPYFFKQIDKVTAIPDELMVRQLPSCATL